MKSECGCKRPGGGTFAVTEMLCLSTVLISVSWMLYYPGVSLHATIGEIGQRVYGTS